jgi:hypothetical protein
VTLTEGMTISIRTRQDVVVVDPQQFLAAARRAYRELDPDITDEAAAEAVVSVYDAVHTLLDRYGELASDHPDIAAGATPIRHMHGGVVLMPATGSTTGPTGSHRPAPSPRSCWRATTAAGLRVFPSGRS